MKSLIVVALAAVACGDPRSGASGALPVPRVPTSGAAPGVGGAGSPTGAVAPAPPAIALDPEPRLDLVANQRRWHRFAEGLLISFAGEGAGDGLAKYSLAYQRPWGAVIERGGRRGRLLAAKRAVLDVPWIDALADDGRATLRLNVDGGAKAQRVTVTLGGKASAAVALAPGWSQLVVALPAGALRAGENQLGLGFSRAGALLHSLELVAGDSGALSDWPDESPVTTATPPALRGHRRLSLWLEVPSSAYLVTGVRVSGDAEAQVRIVATAVAPGAAAPETAVLLDERVRGGGADGAHQISLAALADRVVRLDLEVDAADPAQVSWLAPAIALATPASPGPAPAAATNLVLLVVDTLRSDRLPFVGPTRVTTPRMSAEVAARGTVFVRNQAMAPSSPPSHASIHTSLIPRLHGITGDTGEVAPGAPIVSAILHDAGVYTAYVGNNDFAMGNFKTVGKWDEQHTPILEGKGADCAPLIARVLAIATAQHERGQRFFISALPIEPHVPYSHHPGITEAYYDGPWSAPFGKAVSSAHLGRIGSGSLKPTAQQWQQLRGLYDGEVTYFDGCFGALIDGLAAIDPATAIVLTSDHGEGQGERGHAVGHAYSLHSELTSVPLVILAGAPGGVVETVTSNLDILPTVLDLMGVAAPRGGALPMQGRSLLPLRARGGPWLARVIPSEYGRSYALRARDWKYLVDYDGSAALYAIGADPEERNDVADAQPLVTRYLRDAAGIYLAYRTVAPTAAFQDLVAEPTP